MSKLNYKMDCCRKPYNILTATGLMPSGNSQPCCGAFVGGIVFPAQPYVSLNIVLSDFIRIEHNCAAPVDLLITVTQNAGNIIESMVYFTIDFNDSYQMHVNGSDVVPIPAGQHDIFFSLENINTNNTCISISIYNATCNIDYGEVISNMCVTYVT